MIKKNLLVVVDVVVVVVAVVLVVEVSVTVVVCFLVNNPTSNAARAVAIRSAPIIKKIVRERRQHEQYFQK